MLGEAKLIGPPLIAVGVIFSQVLDSLPNAFRVALDVVALGVLFAGFLILGKLRAQAAAAEGAARAWRDERDAVSEKAERLQEDVAAAREEAAALRAHTAELLARPTLDALVSQIEHLRQAVHEVAVRLPEEKPS